MRDSTFNEECANRQIKAVNLTYSSIQDCMGDSDADHQHPLLQVSPQHSVTALRPFDFSLHMLCTQ